MWQARPARKTRESETPPFLRAEDNRGQSGQRLGTEAVSGRHANPGALTVHGQLELEPPERAEKEERNNNVPQVAPNDGVGLRLGDDGVALHDGDHRVKAVTVIEELLRQL